MSVDARADVMQQELTIRVAIAWRRSPARVLWVGGEGDGAAAASSCERVMGLYSRHALRMRRWAARSACKTCVRGSRRPVRRRVARRVAVGWCGVDNTCTGLARGALAF